MRESDRYAAEVTANIVRAVRAGGFPIHYYPNELTLESIGRTAAVLDVDPGDFFPPMTGRALSLSRSESRSGRLVRGLGRVLRTRATGWRLRYADTGTRTAH